MYQSGDLNISKQTLINLLRSFSPGEYSTFDIIEKYQGIRACNQGVSAKKSWNANFGKILMMHS